MNRIHLMALWVAQVTMIPTEDPWPSNVLRFRSDTSSSRRRAVVLQVVQLREEGHTLVEISRAVGLPVHQVTRLLRRAEPPA